MLESKHKDETTKLTAERDELIKNFTKIEHKEAQYKHEIKNQVLQLTKLQEQLKAKLFEIKKKNTVGGKENAQPDQLGEFIQASAKILASNEVKFCRTAAESDLNLMITKSREDL
jgi:hypothetical protein